MQRLIRQPSIPSVKSMEPSVHVRRIPWKKVADLMIGKRLPATVSITVRPKPNSGRAFHFRRPDDARALFHADGCALVRVRMVEGEHRRRRAAKRLRGAVQAGDAYIALSPDRGNASAASARAGALLIENSKHCEEFLVTAKKPVVGYIFARVRKKLRTAADLNSNTWLKIQRMQIVAWAKQQDLSVSKNLIVSQTTYGGSSFSQTADFRKAIRRAQELGCDLALADCIGLLARTSPENMPGCLECMDRALVTIWDACRNRTWQSLSEQDRCLLRLEATTLRRGRSDSIRHGLQLKSASRRITPAANGRRGNAANRGKADAAARRLAPFVRREMEGLPPGASLSPSALARALNENNILPPRAQRWSANGASNLMKRLQNLRLLSKG